ncbi:MAG: nitrite/sulfite reductase [Polyangiaceae bacterium]
MESTSWKERLEGKIAPDLAKEIDAFETQLELRKLGKIEEKLFAETRLRRGIYGQRYDNGQRNDGIRTQQLEFPCGPLTKGPSTVWDAPGMMRIKIPFGGLTAEQMDVLAEVAEEYSDAILHVTTRQDVQLHFVVIDDTPSLMRRLAAVGITTREACGNSVRNVTACPYSGVCPTEGFDTTPYAHALAMFLLGHPDTQDFGRKFKIAFSGCKEEACALTSMHDLGAIAKRRVAFGKEERGFELYVGGGLGAVPQEAKLFDEFLPERELFPISQAISRVFARIGEKKNRARARLKFNVSKLGIDEFKRMVLEERAALPEDPRWTSWLDGIDRHQEQPLRPPIKLGKGPRPQGFDAWRATNVRMQRQEGYAVVTVALPLGDLTSDQMRALADLARRFTGDNVRCTVEQNIAFRWVSEADLPDLHAALCQIGLGAVGAGTIVDVTACPGTDTCKLGISSSRGLAGELRTRLAERAMHADEAVGDRRIKVSGCFNACGQHHIADLGFWGVSRKVAGYTVPHFQVVLGGKWKENAGAFGLAIGAVPSKNIPQVVVRLTDTFRSQRQGKETFQSFIQRIGKAKLRSLLDDLIKVPSRAEDASFYSDWGDPREYSIGDLGVGECAGEVVPFVEFGLAESEREVFEAQLSLDKGDPDRAVELAYQSMISAAKALTRSVNQNIKDDAEVVVAEFRERLVDTKLFNDPFAGDKFAQYLFHVHGQPLSGLSPEVAHQRVEEATLFIEAAHACYGRMSEGPVQV